MPPQPMPVPQPAPVHVRFTTCTPHVPEDAIRICACRALCIDVSSDSLPQFCAKAHACIQQCWCFRLLDRGLCLLSQVPAAAC